MALLLLDKDVRQLLTMDAALAAVEDAFLSLARGDAVNVPRQRGVLPEATLNVLAAVSRKLDAAVLKSYPVIRKDVTVGSSLTLLLYRISTGRLDAIMEASSLGRIRTGAASGVAARYMARPDSKVMTLFGSGFQAQTQVEALARVLPSLERINVVSRSAENARRFCASVKASLDVEAVHAQNIDQALGEADVITTATGTHQPLFDGDRLRPGVHISAVGSNYAEKRELDSVAIQRSSRIVVDDIAVAKIESGDLIAAANEIDLDWNSIRPLSDIVGGLAPGRVAPDEITLFESQGIGLEDLAVACHVLSRARESGCGIEVPIR
jgi:ornithine cyclodeaminase/alanine dehydrogenase-like protein (mu-crystallin family)